MTQKIVITIDGPAGAGKTTVSRMLAHRLGYTYVDTGALYRGIALAAKQRQVDPEDDAALGAMCRDITLSFIHKDGLSRLMLNGRDISDAIRIPEISMLASAVSARPVVREFLLSIQHRMGQEKAAVFEGRDMGTVVFPRAEVKFYLDASQENRALRRYRDLARDKSITLEQVRSDMEKRDHDDSHRALAPLKPAHDAMIIDSSKLDIEGVVSMMLSRISRCLGESGDEKSHGSLA